MPALSPPLFITDHTNSICVPHTFNVHNTRMHHTHHTLHIHKSHTHHHHTHTHTHTHKTICPHVKVLRMALKAIAVLSTSKASLEVEPPPVHVHSTEGLSQAQTADVSSRTHLNKYFRLFLVELLRMFNSNRVLLDNKGPSIIR